MRHYGILGKQQGKLVAPFRLLVFEEFFAQGEILDYIYQVCFFRATYDVHGV